ncbi:MAG: HAD family hydrolase [Phycisphaerae bacterium]|jgi:phosphoglycolate phosphatase
MNGERDMHDGMIRAGIIFDFDGTLTKPYLDFDAIRAEIGVEGYVLEAVARLEPDDRRRAEEILLRYEREAAENASLQDGAVEVVNACRSRGYPVGILTRNARASVDLVLRRYRLTVDAVRTREDGAIKPSPESLLSICEELHLDPHKSWMVGDHRMDIETGIAAGCRTVLLMHPDTQPEFADHAHHVIDQLADLLDIINQTPNP